MSNQDTENDNLPKPNVTRRTIFTLAAAVATFGAAMGMRASPAWALDKNAKAESEHIHKREGKVQVKQKSRGEDMKAHKADITTSKKGEGSIIIKNTNDKNKQ